MNETQPWPIPPLMPPIYPHSKLNVIAWFGNVEGVDPTYHTDWPQWQRWAMWTFIRNPLFNFFRFIVGVEDRALMVTGPVPVFTPVLIECSPPSFGWKWAIIRTGWLALPFVSYCSQHWVLYLGWVPSGGRLSAKVNYRP